MGPGPAFSLLPIVLLVIVVALAVGVALLIGRSRRGPRVTEPSCGGCGYAVEGLDGMRCPECGADLREVGIITPESQASGRPGLQLILLTALWSILALVGGAGAVRVAQVTFPPPQTGTSIAQFGLIPRPDTGNVDGLQMTSTGTNLARGYDGGLVQILLDSGSYAPGLDVDYRARTAKAVTLGGPEGDFDADLVETWLAADGVVAEPSYIHDLRDEVVRLVDEQASGRGSITAGAGGGITQGVTVQSTSRTVQRATPIVVAQLGALVLWVLGMGILVRRYLKARV